MGGESSGGGGGSTYDAAPMNYARQKRQREKEEQRVKLAEQEDQRGYYARDSKGNVVRSSSGSAVTSRAGAKVVDDFRSQEVDEQLGEQKGMVAQLQLEKRLRDTPFIGTVGILAKKNLERQLADLKAGGAPQFRRTSTGRYVATGVNRPGQASDSSPNIANNPAYSSGDDGGGSSGGVSRRAVASQQTQTTASDVSGGTARKLLGQSASGVRRRKIYEFGR